MHLELDPRLLRALPTGGISVRSEEISSFCHSGRLLQAPHESQLYARSMARYFQFERSLESIFGAHTAALWGLIGQEAFSETGLFKLYSGQTLRLNGDFANPNFFSDMADEIRAQVMQVRNPSKFFLETKAKLERENPIILHLRLGDYIRLERVYGRPSPNYFRDCLARFASVGDGRPIWIFSDDPEAAKEMMSGHIPSAHYILTSKDSRPIESLVLMSASDIKILSNSTFSWWAAFIGQPNSKVTVFPRTATFTDSEPNTGLLLPGWISVDR